VSVTRSRSPSQSAVAAGAGELLVAEELIPRGEPLIAMLPCDAYDRVFLRDIVSLDPIDLDLRSEALATSCWQTER
jgi:hypothetical protein